MSSLKLFGNKTLYEILELPQDVQIKDGNNKTIFLTLIMFLIVICSFTVKRQYYKLALIYHPDRVSDDKKSKAKEEFNIIHQAYKILSDVGRKKTYDDGFDVFLSRATISAQWESHLKIVTEDDLDRTRNKYQGSAEEKKDILREIVRGNGSLTHLLNNIPFMRVEDEERITKIVKDLIKDNEIPKTKIKKIAKRR